jgi:D-arabinose 1-dehydrogenase-like Zn-dependent alcohol dehydrogenase
MLTQQITIAGSIMGTMQDLKDMMGFVVRSRIVPEIGTVVPMEEAMGAFRAMWEGTTRGKAVFTR